MEFSGGKSDFVDVLWMEKWKLQSHNLPVLPRKTLSALRTSMVKKELREKLFFQQVPYFSALGILERTGTAQAAPST